MEELDGRLRQTTPDSPIVDYEVELKIQGKLWQGRMVCRALWTQDNERKYQGAIGKIVEIKKEEQE